jgi:DDE superfamily endonuclease
MQLKAQ